MNANDIIQYEQLLNRIEKLNQDFALRITLTPHNDPCVILLENRVKCNLTNILFQANDLAELIIFINGFESGLINKKEIK